MMMPSGKHVYPLDLKLDDITLDDMAHNLGQICRYNGSVDEFYSVAEHSVLISQALERDGYPPMTQLQGQLHDGHEYIYGDMIRPLKNAIAEISPAAASMLKQAADRADVLIAQKFELVYPFHPIIKAYDDRIVNDEKKFLFGTGKPWTHGGEPLGVKIQCWEPREARRQFRFRFYELADKLGYAI